MKCALPNKPYSRLAKLIMEFVKEGAADKMAKCNQCLVAIIGELVRDNGLFNVTHFWGHRLNIRGYSELATTVDNYGYYCEQLNRASNMTYGSSFNF